MDNSSPTLVLHFLDLWHQEPCIPSFFFFFTTACSLDYVIISVSLHPESDSSVLLSDESLGFFSLCVSLLFIVLLGDLQPLDPV